TAVLLQIRSECDAVYPSSLEPWSYWLTGEQGVAPSPYYDPLEFAIAAAHARGMELHAWLNPYRAERAIGSYTLSSSHVVKSQPGWILTFPAVGLNLLDPGSPGARAHIAGVVADVVRRYDVDGVHFDDYFYPYPVSSAGFPGITTEDAASFAADPRGFASIAAWRRDNVNLLVRMVDDSIKALKPHVRFGLSPFGIWRNGVPPGIVGMDAYSAIYCDAPAWLRQGTVDYLTPQLYWPIGGGQDYASLVSWWADSAARYGRDLIPGMAPYRMTSSTNPFSASEIPNQMRLNRAEEVVRGEVFFRARNGITDNPKGFADSLRTTFYTVPALHPAMPWKDPVPPGSPITLVYDSGGAGGLPVLRWQPPAPAPDGDTAWKYVVYRFDMYPLPEAFENPVNILGLTDRTSFALPAVSGGPAPSYYAVTAVDRFWNEGDSSNVARFPGIPTGVPADAGYLPAEFALSQNYPNPFNPTTTIRYRIAGVAGSAASGQAGGSGVSLKVYDLLGREVAVLVDEVRGPGEYDVRFDGRHLPSGVYYYRLTVRPPDSAVGRGSGSGADVFVETRQMLLVR
ncbi:MAG: hypothetical protein H6Q28_1651, partial [Bacteroidetes bacterium]|nr:hypothetical protein [Bacteroidota bacterium]